MACSLILLAAVDRNWAIGRNNALLYRIPEDMRQFRRLTTGGVVVCGRRTLESFPGGQPLPNRHTILLSHTFENTCGWQNFAVTHSVPEVFEQLADVETAYIIGGERVYRAFYSYCQSAILTEIDAETLDADAFFPPLRLEDGWTVVERSELQTSVSGVPYRFVTYHNKKPNR